MRKLADSPESAAIEELKEIKIRVIAAGRDVKKLAKLREDLELWKAHASSALVELIGKDAAEPYLALVSRVPAKPEASIAGEDIERLLTVIEVAKSARTSLSRRASFRESLLLRAGAIVFSALLGAGIATLRTESATTQTRPVALLFSGRISPTPARQGEARTFSELLSRLQARKVSLVPYGDGEVHASFDKSSLFSADLCDALSRAGVHALDFATSHAGDTELQGCIEKIPDVQDLHVSDTSITDSGLRDLSRSTPNLRFLSAESVPISTGTLLSILSLPQLRFLDIRVDLLDPKELRSKPTTSPLESLELYSHAPPPPGLLSSMGPLAGRVASLELEGEFPPAEIAGLRDWTSLKKVELVGDFNCSHLRALAEARPDLEGLDLSYTRITGKCAALIARFSLLKELDISGTKGAALLSTAAASRLPLESIVLCNMPELPAQLLRDLAEAGLPIISVVAHDSEWTDSHFQAISALPKLASVTAPSSKTTTLAMFHGSPSLREIFIGGGSYSDEDAAQLLISTKVQVAWFLGARKIGEKTLRAADTSSDLRELNIRYTGLDPRLPAMHQALRTRSNLQVFY